MDVGWEKSPGGHSSSYSALLSTGDWQPPWQHRLLTDVWQQMRSPLSSAERAALTSNQILNINMVPDVSFCLQHTEWADVTHKLVRGERSLKKLKIQWIWSYIFEWWFSHRE